MARLFLTKSPFTRERVEFAPFRVHERTKYLKVDRLSRRPSVAPLIVRAMLACNDMQTAQFLNWNLMVTSIDLAEGKLSGDPYDGMTQDAIVMHRRWVFRMMAVTLQDMIYLFHEIRRSRELMPVRDVLLVAECLGKAKLTLKKGDRAWLHNLRNKTAAHLSDNPAWNEAILRRTQNPAGLLGKMSLNTRPFAMRYDIADEILATLTLNGVWSLVGYGPGVDTEADEITTWISDLGGALFGFFQVFCQEAITQFDLV